MAAANSNVELLKAAEIGDLEAVQRAISTGANINTEDAYKQTPLFIASLQGYYEIVDFLIANGAIIDAKNVNNITPLLVATENGHYLVVNSLLNAGAYVNAKTIGDYTPLQLAAWKGYNYIVALLLERGANPKIKNQDGKTALDLAEEYGHDEVVRLLQPSLEPVIDPPVLEKVLSVLIYDTATIPGHIEMLEIPAKIVDIGPCQLEVTEAAVTNFNNKLEELISNKYYKEILHYAFPSLFPTEAPIDLISIENPLHVEMPNWDLLKTLNDPSLDIKTRRFKIKELLNVIVDEEIIELLNLSYKIIKPTQVVKVEFQKYNPDKKFGYYALYNCSSEWPVNIADEYNSIREMINYNNEPSDETIVEISPLIPQLIKKDKKVKISSHLPDLYTLPEITAINSWITHGLLSTYLMRPDYLKLICTNPIVGNEGFWEHVKVMMEEQFAHLLSISKPLTKDLIVYRGSPHFKEDAVSLRTIIATSTVNFIANRFNKRLAKTIVVPAGTRVIDLEYLNILEREFLILPSHEKLLIEPVKLSGNYSVRNKYRIRNAGGVGRRRRNTQKRKRSN